MAAIVLEISASPHAHQQHPERKWHPHVWHANGTKITKYEHEQKILTCAIMICCRQNIRSDRYKMLHKRNNMKKKVHMIFGTHICAYLSHDVLTMALNDHKPQNPLSRQNTKVFASLLFRKHQMTPSGKRTPLRRVLSPVPRPF